MFPKDPATRRRLLRTYLLLLAVPQVLIGVWALVDPSGWYTTFPGGGKEWLPLFGSYDEHLARDVGASFLAIGVLLLLAALWLDRRVVLAAGAAYLTYQLPHFVYHLTADDVMTTGDQITNGILLGPRRLHRLALFRAEPPRAHAPRRRRRATMRPGACARARRASTPAMPAGTPGATTAVRWRRSTPTCTTSRC